MKIKGEKVLSNDVNDVDLGDFDINITPEYWLF